MQRLALEWKRSDRCVGFVPTMGYLHEGHISLVRHARQWAGPSGVVVVSIYVNPTQFGPQEDLSRYPRDLPRDRRRCADAGVDILFVPSDHEVYPPDEPAGRGFNTYVVEESLAKFMEGVSRPTHFRGVTTIVAKLFNLVLPDYAVFGAKDFQQAAVIQRMVRDLAFPVQIKVAPTLREPDGLALSSRNQYLSTDERRQAVVLWQAIQQAQSAVRSCRPGLPASRLRRQLMSFMHRCPAARVDYVAFFDPASLAPVRQVKPGVHLALAVFIGKTRLIDNAPMRAHIKF
jgi:pantoate--beta-alanine ligase